MDLRELSNFQGVRHPWEVARARHFRRVLTGHFPSVGPIRALDVGAGDGYLARELLAVLPAGSTAVCQDDGYDESQLERLRPAAPAGLTFARTLPDNGGFDLVLLMDVIEHVNDDLGFVTAVVKSHLHRNGLLLVTVPAWEEIFTQHDVSLGHRRRYSSGQLARLLADAGLRAVAAGGLFPSLLLARAVEKADEIRRGVRSRPHPDGVSRPAPDRVARWRAGRAFTALATLVLSADSLFSSLLARTGFALPGLSAWALCKPTRS